MSEGGHACLHQAPIPGSNQDTQDPRKAGLSLLRASGATRTHTHVAVRQQGQEGVVAALWLCSLGMAVLSHSGGGWGNVWTAVVGVRG